MKCGNCGFETEEGVKFCPECGVLLTENVNDSQNISAEKNDSGERVENPTDAKENEDNSEYVINDSDATIPEEVIETKEIPQPDVSSGVNYNVFEQEPKKGKFEWAYWAGFFCALGGFVFNPCGLTVVCAITFSIMGLCGGSGKKGFALAGLIIGVFAFIVQALIDFLSMGVGFFF